MTYDGSNLRLYVNDALAKEKSMTGAIPVNNYNLCIGSNVCSGGRNYFNGTIDEVKILNIANP